MTEDPDKSQDTPEVEPAEEPQAAASETPEADVASEALVPSVDAAAAGSAGAESPGDDAEDDDSEADEPEPTVPAGEPEAPVTPPTPVRGSSSRRPSRSRKPAETAADAAPRRSRSRREPGVAAPVVRAEARYVRSSARKARLVCDNIRGKTVEEARAILAVTPRAVARDWSKLLESAVANAEHNHELVGEDLYVKTVKADEGPTIKRFRPRAMGRATKIRKRTAHLTILLTPKD
jgi:ribosomal protein L22